MAIKCVQISIRGRVTGVYFRASAQREAKRLGITGWVRNRNDASIEILAEGEEDAIKELVSWAHHGPSAARVENVDVRYRSYSGDYSDFLIIE
jgi:acylphosphatase